MSSNQIWGSASASRVWRVYQPLHYNNVLHEKWPWLLETSDRDSSTMWPNEARQVESVVRNLNTTSESPSKITSRSSISSAKVIDFLHASASKSSTDWGKGTCSDKAAITMPSESLMMMPKPAQLMSGKIAPSQLALYRAGDGGSQ